LNRTEFVDLKVFYNFYSLYFSVGRVSRIASPSEKEKKEKRRKETKKKKVLRNANIAQSSFTEQLNTSCAECG
jgi:hypothetical protein